MDSSSFLKRRVGCFGRLITLEVGREEVVIDGLVREWGLEKTFLMIDIRGLKTIDRPSRQLFASDASTHQQPLRRTRL